MGWQKAQLVSGWWTLVSCIKVKLSDESKSIMPSLIMVGEVGEDNNMELADC
jgi:hypothetical protein